MENEKEPLPKQEISLYEAMKNKDEKRVESIIKAMENGHQVRII